jgi:hypothetical protein
MNEDAVAIAVIVVISAVSTVLCLEIGSSTGKDRQLNNMRETYKTCLVAHAEVNGESEQACAKAQDETSTEFLCNQQGHCWVEVK